MSKKDSSKQNPLVMPQSNGLLYYFIDFESKTIENLIDSEGHLLKNIKGVALCRCDESDKKPF